MGAVLTQNTSQWICLFSITVRHDNQPEEVTTIEKETCNCPITTAILPILLGAQFSIRTDHKLLSSLKSPYATQESSAGKPDCNFEAPILHIDGKHNVYDLMSRLELCTMDITEMNDQIFLSLPRGHLRY